MVVVAIIMILAAAVMIVINPAEMMKKSRDATRLSDLTTVRNAINIVLAQTDDPLPVSGGVRNSETGARNCDGTGTAWVNLDLCDYLATLPVDPTNSATYRYEYAAVGGQYELRVQLESAANNDKETGDGGSNNDYYEIGTDLDTIP